MSIDPIDFVVATGVSLVFLLLSWAYARALRAGRPLTSTQRNMILYSFVFVLGGLFLMAFGGNLGWSSGIILSLIALWASLVISIAIWRYRRTKRTE